MQGGGLTSDTSASTTFAVGPARAASLIYASAATVAATSETATAGPTVFGDFMGNSFVGRAAWWLGAMASFNVEAAACSADPVDLRIGHSRRNLKFRLDMHSISVGYRCLKALCACAPSVCDQPSRAAPYSGRAA